MPRVSSRASRGTPRPTPPASSSRPSRWTRSRRSNGSPRAKAKMNPRNDRVFGSDRRRIIRRGVPFGLPYDPAAPPADDEATRRGLLFIAYMASLEEQFEFLQ